jgi:cholesterol transport system auxiliary component
MTALRIGAAVCAAFALAACSIGKPVPQATTYVVEPPPPARATTRSAETLRMDNVRVASAFAGNALVYRMGNVKYTADFYHAFIADPGAMLGGEMADWLGQAGPFKTVAQPGSTTPASFVLDAVVTGLYGDFRPGRAPAAVMTVQFTLVDLRGVTPKVVLERTIGRRIPLADATPDALVDGYGQALGQILGELVPEMAAVVVK